MSQDTVETEETEGAGRCHCAWLVGPMAELVTTGVTRIKKQVWLKEAEVAHKRFLIQDACCLRQGMST